MHTPYFYDIPIIGLIYAPVCSILWVLILLLIKKTIFTALQQKLSQKTSQQFKAILIAAFDIPLTIFIFASGIFVLETLQPAWFPAHLSHYLLMAIKALIIIGIILFLDSLCKSILKTYPIHGEIIAASGGMLYGIIRTIILTIGILILLDSFGVSITPLLTSLGIGSLAVALALQPTLENFFSGLQLVADKPIKLGQCIKLESGEEGFVHKIGWRSTHIKLFPNNMLIIPNKFLVNSRIINYHYPEKELMVTLECGIHYDSDLHQVERITIDVAREIMKTVPGGVPHFEPRIRYHTFADSSINFTLIMAAQEFSAAAIIKHECIKQLRKRYHDEKIIIPYPTRTIEAEKGKSLL